MTETAAAEEKPFELNLKPMTMVVGGIVLIGVLFAAAMVLGYVGWSNDALKFEADIPAQYQQMQNVYDNGWKQVMENNQIPDKYASQIKDAYQGILAGRYGKDGAHSAVQLIQEQNPQFDASLYRKVQESIERFHAQFESSQTQIIALKQSYQTLVFATTSGRMYNSLGRFPHIHCGIPPGTADDYQIVTSSQTDNAFREHKAGALQLK